MKLYYVPGACSLSPHIVAREMGIDLALERVDLATRKTESGEDYLAVNPNGYVPALRLADGTVLTEGPAIVQYLAEQNPSAGLMPDGGPAARALVRAQLNFIASELHKLFHVYFTPGAADEDKATARTQIARRFDYVEQVLSDGRRYFSGESFTVADAYLFVVAGWSNMVGIVLDSWPRLGGFLGRVAARPRVQDALKAEGLA